MPRRPGARLRFPTIPHLFGSASEPGDVVLSPAQTRAFLSGPVRVTEKFDGLNVGLAFTPGLALRFVSREHGLVAPHRLGRGLWPLLDFAFSNLAALLELLGAHSVLFGEWLGGPRRLGYPRRTTDFVGFDLYERARRRFVAGREVERRLAAVGLTPAPARFEGHVASVPALLACVPRSAFGGPGEGVVVERADGQRAKVVRTAWLRLPLREEPPVAPPPSRTRAPAASRHFTKRFPPGREEDARREAALLRVFGRAGLAPRVLDLEPRAVVMTRVVGRRLPEVVSPRVAAALGATLANVHHAGAKALRGGLALPALTGGPVEHARRAAADDVARLLRAQLAAQAPPTAATVCHGDVKPENVLVHRGHVTLVDFERACVADPAWEVACAMDRLRLGPTARRALLDAYAPVDPGFALRVHAFRVAWLAALPRAVANLEVETGRRPSARARQLAREAARQAQRLRRALVAARAGGPRRR